MMLFCSSRLVVKRGGGGVAVVVACRPSALFLRLPRRQEMCQRRTLVWHAGYLQEQEAHELVKAIQDLQKRLDKSKFHQCMGTQQQLETVRLQEKRLTDLYEEYETVTGESYQQQHRQEEDRSTTTTSGATI
eukprot:scaffold482_cov266-Amphora_coffeaeformis.AAC.48